jgi:hypothetical protein
VLDESGAYAGAHVDIPVRLVRAAGRPRPTDLDIRTRLDAQIDGLTLLGANLDTTAARPGERLYLTLFWQAGDAPPVDRDVTLSLGDVTLYEGGPVHGTYAFSSWQAGEVVADRYDPRVPRNTEAGTYPLTVAVAGAQTEIGEVAVEAIARTFDAPPLSHPLTATLGSKVALLGYDVSPGTAAPGDTLLVTLAWRALEEMDESYTVFAHLLAPDGSMTGQHDALPAGGTHPTDLWLAGEVVVDVHEIAIPTGAVAGAHRLEAGMYLAESGERLAVDGGPGDAVVLQTVSVHR